MNKLRALLATATMGLMLGCDIPVWAQDYMENPKFLRRDAPVLGLNVDELKEVLDTPQEIRHAGCTAPYEVRPGMPPVPVTGNAWIYETQTDVMRASLVLCVVNNHAVVQTQTIGIVKGSRITVHEQMILDTDLIEKAFRGKLDEDSHEDRILPRSGPEYEI